MKVLIDNKIFYLEGCLNEYGLYVNLFHINYEYRGIGLSYSIWRNLQEKYKVDINLQAFFTLISYYKKMGFTDLGMADDSGYHDFTLKYKTK